jgi:hypothetical protein
MTIEEKAKNIFDKMCFVGDDICLMYKSSAKQCAIIAIENEYNSLREQLFNLKSCRIIESETVYLKRIEYLIEEEKQVKAELIKLK